MEFEEEEKLLLRNGDLAAVDISTIWYCCPDKDYHNEDKLCKDDPDEDNHDETNHNKDNLEKDNHKRTNQNGGEKKYL